jgi:alkylated DNA repair protein (DNA oxidative demethylase)
MIRSEAVTADLFGENDEPREEPLGDGAVLLRGFALPFAQELASCVDAVAALAPFRHMETPGGFPMSVAMTNCGAVGWVTDRRGYRYDPRYPVGGDPWPPMPELFRALAAAAADRAGFAGFAPDSCLINRYEPGARMSLHQDRNERDMAQPIMSVSLGLPAIFLFGGLTRAERARRIPLRHGDVVVWGGPSRLAFHGVAALPNGDHESLGRLRYNLTFRKAL